MDFSDEIIGSVNKCDVLMLCNEMCQYVDLHNLVVNHYFPDNQCVMLQNHVWINGSFKIQSRAVDFNVTV